jgi:hypothetical protein
VVDRAAGGALARRWRSGVAGILDAGGVRPAPSAPELAPVSGAGGGELRARAGLLDLMSF